jgi:hypothetical protein
LLKFITTYGVESAGYGATSRGASLHAETLQMTQTKKANRFIGGHFCGRQTIETSIVGRQCGVATRLLASYRAPSFSPAAADGRLLTDATGA